MQLTQPVGDGIAVTLEASLWRLEPDKGAIAARAAARASTPIASVADWLAHRLLVSGRVIAATSLRFDRQPGARIPALGRADAPRVHVQLAAHENAVLLVESEGVMAWQFADGEATRTAHAPARREAAFTLVAPLGAHAASAQQAAFGTWFLERLRVVVLRFAARQIGAHALEWLERDKRTGPVVIDDASEPASWMRVEAFPTASLPKDRSAKLLLFVHGSFSSVASAFGALCATAAGRAFLEQARGRYDAVVGWDHRTLALDPRANATELHERLRAMALPVPPTLDIVCHSRGSLVVRSLIEEVLPGEAGRPVIGRVVFAGATNTGTPLARASNWRSFIDLTTNLHLSGQAALAALGAGSVAIAAAEAFDWVADLVGYLAQAGLDPRVAPGLAAMDPDGAFVRTLNEVNPGEPDASDALYYAVESNFEPTLVPDTAPREFPRRLALLLANGFVDTLMNGVRNDLVVDVPSMTAIDASASGWIKGLQDYGKNARVYHTNYFLQPETVAALRRWLLDGQGDARPDAPMLDSLPERNAGQRQRESAVE